MAFRKAYLLLPLCLVSAILLNVYAAVDPTGVYRRYLEKLAPMTPPVAAMATALADGVYPWSTQQANGPVPQPTPQPRPEPIPEPEPAPVPEPEPEPAEPTTADLYARRPRKRKAVADQLARELEAEDDTAAADASKGGDE